MYPPVAGAKRWITGSILMALLLLMLPRTLLAASVFEEIQVDTTPSATTVRIVFVAPIRYQSHTPAKRGSELRILVRALSADDFDPDALYGRETRGWAPDAPHPLRSLSYEGSQVTGSQLKLEFRLAVDFTVRGTPDLRSLVITLPTAIPQPAVSVKPAVKPPEKPQAPLKPEREPATVIQRKATVIYLESSLKPIAVDAVAGHPAFQGKELFQTTALVRGREWYRLTLGYYGSNAEAKAVIKTLRARYPGAWVGSHLVATKVEAVRPIPVDRPVPSGDRIGALMQAAKRAMTNGEYANAAQLFTAILESPHSEYTEEAQELLGLARERNGQLAHARAEYEEYLRRYPRGEGADRVRQRLAGVVTAKPSEREVAAAQEDPEKRVVKRPAEWNWFGSFSQQYFRDQTTTAPDPLAEKVNVATLTTWLNLTGRRRGPDYDFRTQINMQHDHDYEALTDPDGYSFSDLYVEWTKKSNRSSLRFGRQRHTGSGTLGRFDGLLFSYPTSDAVTVSTVLGHPVDLNDKSRVQSNTSFFGVSANIAPSDSNWNYNTFALQQERDGILDRQAVGGEIRYFSPEKSLFTLLDYDTSYGELNIFLLQGNLNVSDRTSLYGTLDYRFSPVLTTGNALLSQTVLTLEELQALYTEEEIRQFALDRSARTSTVSFGGSHRVREDLQISTDITATKTDATPASGGVAATEATDTELYYTLQFIANDFWSEGDTAIFGFRYGDTTTSDIFTFNIDRRRPLPNQWRLNPRFLLDYRSQRDTDSSTLRLKPSLRAEYRGWRKVELEFEAGIDLLREDDGMEASDTAGYFLNMGYRWDF